MPKNEGGIAIYSRKSKFTGKGESIGNQVELCREYIRNLFGEADAEGCAVFEDEGFSGGDLKRPAFQRMLAEVRKKKYRAIIVYRLDRISRNISDFTGLIDELSRLEVAFISIREQFDTGTPMGRAMMYIVSVFSQLERETIAERIRDNMHELAKTGRWLGGNPPTGFVSGAVSNVTVDGKTRKSYRLLPVSGEIGIPMLIFDLYTQTDSLTAVEKELLHRRIKTKQGKDFTRFAIKGILQNPVYMVADAAAYTYFTQWEADVCTDKAAFDGSGGIMAYNRTAQEKGRATVLLPVSEWIIAPGQHPGVVPSAQWIRVQESLERNKSGTYRKPRRNEALLTGLLFCACGDRMYPKLSQRTAADGTAVYTYVCRKKEHTRREQCSRRNASGNLLDAAVLEQLRQLAEEQSAFAAQLEKGRRLCGGAEETGTQLEALRTELAQKEKTVSGLIDSLGLAVDAAVRSRVMERIEELTQANRSIAERIGELEGLTAAERLSHAEFDALQRRLASLSACVDAMTVEEKRAAIRAVVRKVIWDGVNAHVVLFGAQDGEAELPELTDRLAPPKASAAQAEEFLDETGETESPTAPMWPWCEDSK